MVKGIKPRLTVCPSHLESLIDPTELNGMNSRLGTPL